jgi:hypothetical protein
MKPKQEPTPTAETPWEPLSPEQITSGIEWLERTKADLRPASRYPAIQQQRAAMNQHPIGSFARLEAARARRRKPADPAIVCVRQDIVTPQRRGPVAGDPVPAMTDCRREADMDSRRRYNSSAAAICGLLGMIILPIVAHRARFRDDRLFSILVVVGLYGLGGHLQTGHRGSLKNRPTGLAEVLMVFPSLGRFERRHLLADDFVFVPCCL